MGKTEEDWNDWNWGFWKLFSLTVFQSGSLLFATSNIMIKRHTSICLSQISDFVSLNFIRLLWVVITPSVTSLLRGENDSKHSDEFQAMILSFTCTFFAYIKFHSDCRRAIGKFKQNELDCRDTVPLKTGRYFRQFQRTAFSSLDY